MIDRNLGGRPAFDITALTVLTLAGVAALIAGRGRRSDNAGTVPPAPARYVGVKVNGSQ